MDNLFEEIKDYLLQKGCKIEYPILVNNFKSYLYNPDSQVQSQIRIQFKDYVNRLATVSVENNMKFINLRPEFRETSYDAVDSKLKKEKIKHQQVAVNPNPITRNPPTIPQHMKSQSIPNDLPRSPARNVQRGEIDSNSTHPRILHSYSNQENVNQTAYQTKTQPHYYSQSSISFQQQEIPHDPRSLGTHIQKSQLRPQPLLSQHSTSQQYNSPTRVQQNHIAQNQQLRQQLHHERPLPPLAPSISLPTTPQKLPPKPRYDDQIILANSDQFQEPAPCQPLTPVHSTSPSDQMPPPRPPPRRRQSNASLFNRPSDNGKTIETRSHNQLNDFGVKSPSKVRERALKLNSYSVSSHLNNMANLVKSQSMRENRLSRDSTMGSLSSATHRLGYNPSMRSRSSHREDESDSSSFQPMDLLRKRWIVEACNCNHRALVNMLKEDQTLSTFKDILGYTALHWAAKAGNLDIIRLMIDSHEVSVNIRASSNGYTPLHLAYMYKRTETINLLMNVFKANPLIRDYSGRRPHQLSFANKL